MKKDKAKKMNYENLTQLSESIRELDEAKQYPIQCEGRNTAKFKAIVSDKTDEIFSVVSNRYCIVQSKAVLNSVVSALHRLDLHNVKGEITEQGGRTYCKVMLPRYISEGNSEKDIQLGFLLINSYDATHSISLQGFSMRLVCSNGMIGRVTLGTAFIHKHIGEVSSSVGQAVSEIINKVIEHSPILQKQIEKAIADTYADIEQVKGELKTIGFGKRSINEILERLESKGSKVNRWELYNAVTNLYTFKALKENSKITNLTKAEKLLTIER